MKSRIEITQQHFLKSEGGKKAKSLDMVHFPSYSGTWIKFNINILLPVFTRRDKSLHWRQLLKSKTSWNHSSIALSWHKWCIQSDGMPRWHKASFMHDAFWTGWARLRPLWKCDRALLWRKKGWKDPWNGLKIRKVT